MTSRDSKVLPDDIVALTPLIRRVIQARTSSDRHHIEDLVQICLGRLIERRAELSSDTLAAYAIIAARNTAVTSGRQQSRHRRHLHRLLELHSPADPADEATRAEEADALRRAMSRIPGHERQALYAHVIDGEDTASIAERTGSTPAAVASLLHRTRGRLRVEYLLAVQRTKLPSAQCHPVLVAISAADRRRQLALRSGEHLLDCPTCAELSQPLIQRRRSTLLVLPFALVADRIRRLARVGRNHPGPTAAATTAAVVVAVVVATTVLAQPHRHRTPPVPATTAPAPPPVTLSSGGVNLFAAFDRQPARAVLSAHANQPVRANAAEVIQLAGSSENGQPDDERFWIGDNAGHRVLVFLHINAEPPNPIVVGQRYDFTGTIEPLPPNPETLGLQPAAAALAAPAGYYIDIPSLQDIQPSG